MSFVALFKHPHALYTRTGVLSVCSVSLTHNVTVCVCVRRMFTWVDLVTLSQVFHNVAKKYDVMNDVMSAGVHRVWKEQFVSVLNPQPGMKLLDVAGGTGDIAFRFIEHVRHAIAAAPVLSYPAHATVAPAEVTVCDINASMLAVGKERAMERGLYPGNTTGACVNLAWCAVCAVRVCMYACTSLCMCALHEILRAGIKAIRHHACCWVLVCFPLSSSSLFFFCPFFASQRFQLNMYWNLWKAMLKNFPSPQILNTLTLLLLVRSLFLSRLFFFLLVFF